MRAQIESLKFSRLSFSHEDMIPLFTDTNVEFPMNSINWIRADIGRGKSTLLKILAGIINPQAGSYYINNENVSEMSFEEFSPYRLAIGYAFDMGGLINNRSIYENLMLPLLYHKILPHPEAKQKVSEFLDYFRLTELRDNRPATVSGGIRKIVCVARSMLLNPQVLLLDDPTIGLNHETVLKLIQKIKSMRDDGFLNHVFICTSDKTFMSHFDYKLVTIENEKIKTDTSSLFNQVVHL